MYSEFQSSDSSSSSSSDYYSWPNCSKKQWPLDDDIVISGIAGRFPESDNLDELAENLLKNVDMVTRDERRWPIGLNNNQTSRSGKLKNLDRFDHTYFCTIPILSDCMEPGSRIILETTYEAIADSGLAPQQIRGTKTGVYVGINTVANAEAIPQDDFSDIRAKDAAFWVYGSSKALLANRISFLFDFNGPSTVIDTACSASLVALANAVQDLRNGNCEMAIVATSNICLAPYSSYVYHSLGLLSNDGKCKVFDKNADGFVRSETVGSIFLMKKSQAKRVYATILHAKTNTDGFKTIGLFAPFWLRQRNLMIETFQEAGIEPEQVDYFESHGTGTNVGDPQESKAVSEAYCQKRKNKLLVGAVKSNLGHTEGASGLCSVAKAIIIFESGIIPANLHYSEPKPEIECLHKTIEPVVKNQSFNGSIIGLNSFGVGGVNAHALLKINSKILNGCDEEMFDIINPIPRLILVCGRTEQAVQYIFDFIEKNPKKIHRDFLALLNDSMKTTCIKGSANFPYRGYMILDHEKASKDNFDKNYVKDFIKYQCKLQTIESTTQVATSQAQQLWLIFTGMGSQWNGMARELMRIETFRQSLEQSAKVLQPFGIDLLKLVLENVDGEIEDEEKSYKPVVNSFVAITSIQIALYDVLKLLELPINGYIGHSFGEIACAYADGCLNAQQALLTSYWRGKTVDEHRHLLPKGQMAAVGLTITEINKMFRNYEGVYIACHNGADSLTISGLYQPMSKFLNQLKAKNIFFRKVLGGDYPYHSKQMHQMAPQLLKRLQSIIPEPKRRSSKWISTSIPPCINPEDVDCAFASGQYFVNNLLRTVYFQEGMQKIPKQSCCLEIAPHSLFQSIFKRCYPDYVYLSMMKRNDQPDVANLLNLLESFGKIYTSGFNPAIEKLYPKVEWPVARGTQSIGSLIRWDHSRVHEVKMYPDYHNFSTSSNYSITISLLDSDWRFLADHRIDGRIVFPLTGYLWIVWRALATKLGQPWHLVPVQFKNVRICRPTFMNDTKPVRFVVQILDLAEGNFNLSENQTLICKGNVMSNSNFKLYNGEDNFLQFQDEIDGELFLQNSEDKSFLLDFHSIYKELKVRGYDYGPQFQSLLKADGKGQQGLVKWTGHWISFVDSALHLSLLSIPVRALFVPVQIDCLKCDPNVLIDSVNQMKRTSEQMVAETVQKLSNGNAEELKTKFCYFDNTDDSSISCDAISNSKKSVPFEMINFSFEDPQPLNIVEKDKEEEKETTSRLLFNVKFDFHNQLLITKGLEIKGLVPVNIPRKIDQDNLIMEQQRFVPFNDYGDFLPDFSLDSYVESCTKITKRFLEIMNSNQNPYETSMENDEIFEEFLTENNDKEKYYRYFSILKEFCRDAMLKMDDDFRNQQFQKLFQEKLPEFQLDILNQGIIYQSELFVRPIMELVAENFQHQSMIKVLEVCPIKYPLANAMIKYLKMNVIHRFQLEYTITKHDHIQWPEINNLSGQLIINSLEWQQIKSGKNLSKNEYDLVIVYDNNQFLFQQNNDPDFQKETFFQEISKTIKPSGFILMITSTRELYQFEKSLLNYIITTMNIDNDENVEDSQIIINTNNSNTINIKPKANLNNSFIQLNLSFNNNNNTTTIATDAQKYFDKYLCESNFDNNDVGNNDDINIIKKKQQMPKEFFDLIASRLDKKFKMKLFLYRKLNHNHCWWISKNYHLIPKKSYFNIILSGFDKTKNNCTNNEYQWIEELQQKLKLFKINNNFDNDSYNGIRIWVVVNGYQNDFSHPSGIIGFANCLRLELQKKQNEFGDILRILAIFDDNNVFMEGNLIDKDGNFNEKSEIFQNIYRKDLVFNIFHKNQWGTYRFVSMTDRDLEIFTDNAHVSQLQCGDLSSLRWFQSEQFEDYQFGNDSKLFLVNVYYSALNFKDVVIASGKIIPGPESALFDCIIGLEFVGRRIDTGQPVMGMVPFKGLATKILTYEQFVWPVPDNWSMEDAATVPVIYVTAYYALVMRGKLKIGEKVLIHSAAGGVGQAALNICLSLNCEIFVTVGNDEKRQFLCDHFNINPKHIFNSRDCNFEKQIKTLTKGYGVDVVLNSLTGDKLEASLQCLAVNGRFLEIGKWDMQMNHQLGMFTFLKNVSFHGIGLDSLFRDGLHSESFQEFFQEVTKLMKDGIENGVVKPINRTVFESDQIEQAFRYMTNGRHIGKVLIRIRTEQKEIKGLEDFSKLSALQIRSLKRTWFNPNKIYLIAGGLGGVGLELIYWMILRGARRFMITTRSGIKSSYQRIFLERFKIIEDFCPDYKILFRISQKNIGNLEECRQLINECLLDGQIGGVFNLTLVLDDRVFENQTKESFENVSKCKADGLYNLHRILMENSSIKVDHFVAFSSFSCGRGNYGQTNYGYANSSMERLIEYRNLIGLPGLAIQFGPIADVGVVADHLMNIDDNGYNNNNEETIQSLLGISLQQIHSCLKVLDQILPQQQGIYSSYLKYEHDTNKSTTDDEVIRQLCSHLNIDRRPEDECLGDIGLDSMAAVEIQQRLERDFNISLTLADVRQITVKELKSFRDGNRHNLKQYSDDIRKAKVNLSRLRFIIPTTPVVALNNVKKGKPIYCLPTLIGIFDLISILTKKIHRPVFGLNWTRQLNSFMNDITTATSTTSTLDKIVDYYYKLIINLIKSNETQQQIQFNENDKQENNKENTDNDENDSRNSKSSTSFDILASDFGILLTILMCKNKKISKKIKFGRLYFIDLLPTLSLKNRNKNTMNSMMMMKMNKYNGCKTSKSKHLKNHFENDTKQINRIKMQIDEPNDVVIEGEKEEDDEVKDDIDNGYDDKLLSDYKVMLIFDYIKLYIPERLCYQSQREVLELNCPKARVSKINELLRKCLGSNNSNNNQANSNNIDMKEIIENTYQRASIMIDYQWYFFQNNFDSNNCLNDNNGFIQKSVIQLLNSNKNIQIDYIKFICDDENDSTNQYNGFNNCEELKKEILRKQLKSMFNLNLDDYENDPDLFEQFKLHLFDNNNSINDDLLNRLDDENVLKILNDL